MKKFLFGVAACIVLSVQLCCISKSIKPELYKRNAYNSVVMLEMEFELLNEKKEVIHPGITATGFAVDSLHLVTAGHFCISGLQNALKSKSVKTSMLYVSGNEELVEIKNFRIVLIDVRNDLCIIERQGHHITPVVFAKDYRPKIRDKVFTVGAPANSFPVETEGVVSLPSVFSSEPEMNGKILCSLAVYKGNSGSPVFNQDRRSSWSCCYG